MGSVVKKKQHAITFFMMEYHKMGSVVKNNHKL